MKMIGPPKDLCGRCLSTTHFDEHLVCDCETIRNLRERLSSKPREMERAMTREEFIKEIEARGFVASATESRWDRPCKLGIQIAVAYDDVCGIWKSPDSFLEDNTAEFDSIPYSAITIDLINAVAGEKSSGGGNDWQG